MREYRKANPSTEIQKLMAIDRTMRARYGMTVDDYFKMVESQKGLCKICDKSPRTRLVVDHCHATGKVRGLLCHSCNRSMALLDNSSLLERAMKYKEST